LAEWLYEQGIGEARAALIGHGRIIEAIVERDDISPRAGAVVEARLQTLVIPRRRAIMMLADGTAALMEPVPAGLAEGARTHVLVTRESIPETGRPKLPRVQATDLALRTAPTLRERLALRGRVRDLLPGGADLLEDAGWSEVIDEAMRGEISFPGGALRISLTPAMTLIDVDGPLPPDELAQAGAAAAGHAIRRLGLAGSIGIDLPGTSGKAARQKAAEALDSALPQPFGRTAVNGFGFLQIVRRRERPSLAEQLQADRPLAAALHLLRQAERATGHGVMTIAAHPTVIDRIGSRPDWVAMLERRTAAPIRLSAVAETPISGGHVSREQP